MAHILSFSYDQYYTIFELEKKKKKTKTIQNEKTIDRIRQAIQ
jgi:hypothetical protein